MSAASTAVIEASFRDDERFLWGLCYRLTGSAADADDLVQETFVRALERPPGDGGRPLRPWLVRVAVNLARDQLRRRKRRRYLGPWLPSPIEIDEGDLAAYEPRLAGGHTTESRYDLMESVSFAFLLALEALTAKQRAVLLLRDVFDYDVRETAEALGISEANVKTTHHRARAAMHAYERERRVPTRELRETTRAALGRFLDALVNGDVTGVESMLSESVRAISDGGGQYHAARKPIAGRLRVARFFLKIASRRSPSSRFELRLINGMPALVGEFEHGRPGEPPRVVLLCDLDADGRIAALYTVLADAKLTAIGNKESRPLREISLAEPL